MSASPSSKTKSNEIKHAIGLIVFSDILDGESGTISKIQDEKVFLIEYSDGKKHVLKTYCYKENEYKRIEFAKKEYKLSEELGKVTPHVAKGIRLRELSKDKKKYIEALFEWGGESLYDIITSADSISPKLILSWAKQSTSAFSAAEKLGIFHSDIKPKNIVIHEGLLKVIDFGSAIEMSSKASLLHTTNCKVRAVTSLYLPPEFFKEYQHAPSGYSKGFKLNHGKNDVYCWGMTFYHVLTRKSEDELEEECMEYKLEGSAEYEGFMAKVEEIKIKGIGGDALCSQFIPILQTALAFDSTDRPTFKSLHRLISAINLPQLLLVTVCMILASMLDEHTILGGINN
eukprot:TRINITY_DN391_c0_g1_i3.p1 TRINITY_DN391_c0_g1~~TRINITY_DN391_c0_g1_i3.p1  ORF type:complete len:344 (+),score=30.97 TRINITY_DN391_c0_g1_i3:477-1508(+)